ncbi:MAG: hypothetical protein MJA83_18020, partial [Gammaproteobacteria bacterium]|nr:hypothetical protein [Gammaproteobacteria bacterium]
MKGMFVKSSSSEKGDPEEMGLADFSSTGDSPASDRNNEMEKPGRHDLNPEELQNLARAINFLIS